MNTDCLLVFIWGGQGGGTGTWVQGVGRENSWVGTDATCLRSAYAKHNM